MPNLPQEVNTHGLKTNGGNNKFWRLLSKDILTKAFNPKEESESSDVSPLVSGMRQVETNPVADPNVKKIKRTQ